MTPKFKTLRVYNGKVSHTVPEIDFFKQFGRNEILAREIFSNPIKLVNLKDEEPQEMTCFAVMETAMKHIHAQDFSPYLRRLIPIINQLFNPTNEQFIIKTLKYIFTRATLMDIDLVNHIGSYLKPTIGEKTMTFAEAWEQKGELKGEIKGAQKEKTLIAREMLNRNMDIELISNVTGLSDSEIEALKR